MVKPYLAKLANIADSFALEGAEIGRDARVFQVDDTGKGLIEEGTDGKNWEVAGFGLRRRISKSLLSAMFPM